MADQTKKELRNQLMYQIFVRNYSEKGTFEGVKKDLDRIRDLGVDIIYLLPVHPIGEKCRKGTLGSPYAIKDYRKINPEFGTLEEFQSLVQAIHDKGMKCIIDVVYNHTSPDSVLCAEHPEWFYRKADGSFGNHVGDWSDIIDLDYAPKRIAPLRSVSGGYGIRTPSPAEPVTPHAQGCQGCAEEDAGKLARSLSRVGHAPALNEGLVEYQIETLRYWAGMVDGFRCDVAPMVPIAFWERARQAVAEVNPDCLWLSESIEPEFIQNLRDQGITAHSDGEIFRAFDVSYDYDIYKDFTGYLWGGRPLSEYVDAVNRQEFIYPDNYVKLRFLENHDQTRAHFLIPDEKALRNFTAFSFFQKGMAFLYAGQEYGATHLPSLFDKDTISLKPENGIDLTDLIRRMVRIKKDPLLADSTYRVTASGEDMVTAVHSRGGRCMAGVFSLKGKAGPAYMPLPDGVYENQIDGTPVEVFREHIMCSGEPVIVKRGE